MKKNNTVSSSFWGPLGPSLGRGPNGKLPCALESSCVHHLDLHSAWEPGYVNNLSSTTAITPMCCGAKAPPHSLEKDAPALGLLHQGLWSQVIAVPHLSGHTWASSKLSGRERMLFPSRVQAGRRGWVGCRIRKEIATPREVPFDLGQPLIDRD